MAVTYKQIFTKPTSNDIWFFEQGINGFAVEPGAAEDQLHPLYVGCTGLLSMGYEETISWAEIVSRKAELRPDLAQIADQSYTVDINGTPVTDTYLNLMVRYAYRQPTHNPFVNTWTRYANFDTMENMQAGYLKYFPDAELAQLKTFLSTVNNTMVEQFYDNGTEISFPGRY